MSIWVWVMILAPNNLESRQHASEVRVQQYLHQHSKKWVVCNAHVFHLSFSHRRRGKNESTGSCYTLHKWSQCVRIISEGEFLFFLLAFKQETYSVTFVKSNNLIKTYMHENAMFLQTWFHPIVLLGVKIYLSVIDVFSRWQCGF